MIIVDCYARDVFHLNAPSNSRLKEEKTKLDSNSRLIEAAEVPSRGVQLRPTTSRAIREPVVCRYEVHLFRMKRSVGRQAKEPLYRFRGMDGR